LRPGEKLYEELVGPDEDATPSHTAEIQCVRSRQPPSANLIALVEHLEADAALGHVDLVRAGLAQLAGLSGQTPSVDRTYQMVAAAAAPVVFNRIDDDSHNCPDCGGRALRSRTRAVHERVYKHFTSERPFRCSTCRWRGWRELRQPAPVSLDPVTPLDLSTLDRFVGPPAAATRRPFSPRNLS
jgi:hypothetical protein